MRDENYAIPVSNVREVLTVPKITCIPQMPDFVRGVINLRGSVVPVLDLRLRFGLGTTSQSEETSIIVTEIPDLEENGAQLRIGILADAVKKVFTIAKDRIEPAPKFGMAVNTAFIDGIGRMTTRSSFCLTRARCSPAKTSASSEPRGRRPTRERSPERAILDKRRRLTKLLNCGCGGALPRRAADLPTLSP